MYPTKIIKRESIVRFKRIISKYGKNINISTHALDHLSNAQRKIFKEEDLINPILKENPKLIGLQRNGRYSVFYRRKGGFLRIILNMENSKIEVVTFMNVDNMPNPNKIKNEK